MSCMYNHERDEPAGISERKRLALILYKFYNCPPGPKLGTTVRLYVLRRDSPERLYCHLKDNLQYPCTATAIASIAHCHSFMFLLRLTWTDDGWMDTSEWEDPLDDDAYYTHLADLDFDC